MSLSPARMTWRLLSDARYQLAALALCPLGTGEGTGTDADATPPYPDLSQSSKIPCLVAKKMPAPAIGALMPAGCGVASREMIGSVDAVTLQPEPASAKYFAGDWYLQAPGKLAGKQGGSRALALKLAQLIANDAETRQIEEIFRQDPALAYNLLKLVNSAGLGCTRSIDSFAQAILFLGRRQLRRWLNLLLFAAKKEDARSALLLARVAVRACMLERLFREMGYDKEGQERAFMVGMFSLLGVLFGMPLADVLRPLKLDKDLTQALLERQGELGTLLQAVEALEQGKQAQTHALLEPLLPGEVHLDRLWLDANVWMLDLVRDQGGRRGG
ncbi:MAG: HDOD domain-containing protein [Rhodoferax sp.]|nr:HDOD domain-containing protein [Rhodoferax sp.]